MGKIKRLKDRLKRLIKELEVADRISDGKLSSAIIAGNCMLLLILIGIYFWIFG